MMINELALFAGKRRWLNRMVRNALPKVAAELMGKNKYTIDYFQHPVTR